MGLARRGESQFGALARATRCEGQFTPGKRLAAARSTAPGRGTRHRRRRSSCVVRGARRPPRPRPRLRRSARPTPLRARLFRVREETGTQHPAGLIVHLPGGQAERGVEQDDAAHAFGAAWARHSAIRPAVRVRKQIHTVQVAGVQHSEHVRHVDFGVPRWGVVGASMPTQVRRDDREVTQGRLDEAPPASAVPLDPVQREQRRPFCCTVVMDVRRRVQLAGRLRVAARQTELTPRGVSIDVPFTEVRPTGSAPPVTTAALA